MERDELALRDRVKNLLEIYDFEYILDINDMTPEDCVVFLVQQYGLLLPDYEPL